VKRNTPTSDGGSFISPAPGGRFVVTNAPLRRIVQAVDNVPPYALVGGPDWLDSTRYDIALAPDSVSLFTALEEQLGLRLAGERTTMEVVVIEHVERPAED